MLKCDLLFYFIKFQIYNMGLHKQYFKVGQNATNQLFGISKSSKSNGTTPLSMLISQGVKLNNSKCNFVYKLIKLIHFIVLHLTQFFLHIGSFKIVVFNFYVVFKIFSILV